MLGRSPFEVEPDLVTRDGDGGLQDEIALGSLEHVGSLEAAVRQAGERCPHDALGVGVQLAHGGDDPIPPSSLSKLAEPPLSEPLRGELGPEVAAALLRVAHLPDEIGEYVVVEPGRRDHDSLIRERA
jgi:hypothetical protein